MSKVLEPGKAVTLEPLAIRPSLYLNSFLEWLVFFAVLLWVNAISICLAKRKSSQ